MNSPSSLGKCALVVSLSPPARILAPEQRLRLNNTLSASQRQKQKCDNNYTVAEDEVGIGNCFASLLFAINVDARGRRGSGMAVTQRTREAV